MKGTVVHEVFGDLRRGRDLDTAIEEQVDAAGLDIGQLGREADEVRGRARPRVGHPGVAAAGDAYRNRRVAFGVHAHLADVRD